MSEFRPSNHSRQKSSTSTRRRHPKKRFVRKSQPSVKLKSRLAQRKKNRVGLNCQSCPVSAMVLKTKISVQDQINLITDLQRLMKDHKVLIKVHKTFIIDLEGSMKTLKIFKLLQVSTKVLKDSVRCN